MKVIFLDIDCVMNTYSQLDQFGIHYICPDRVLILKNIVLATDAKIVLSSTWRRKQSDKDLVEAALAVQDLKLFDCTPVLPHKLSQYIERHEEISHWLNLNPVEKFAVIDDMNEAGVPGFRSSFFKTDEFKGLTNDMALRIVDHLNGVETKEDEIKDFFK